MSQAINAPINSETEITREEIAKLAGTSHSKVIFVTARDKWGFPKVIRIGPKGKQLYPRADVEKWLKANILKNMTFVAEDRAPLKTKVKADKVIDSALVAQLPIGINPSKFQRAGTPTRVHVKENHEYEAPDPRLTRFSNSGVEHRYVGGAFE